MSRKLESKVDKCFFVRYPKKNKKILLLQPFSLKSVCLSKMVFLENDFVLKEIRRRKLEFDEIKNYKVVIH